MRFLLLCTITIVLVAFSQAEQESEVSLQRAAREAGVQPETRRRMQKKEKIQRRKHKKEKNKRRRNQKKKGHINPKNHNNPDHKRRNWGRKQGPQARQGIVINGNNCEYIFLADITSNSGCTTGNKFVLKGADGVRKQFLILNSKATMAFVTKGAKFTACTTFTDITTTVKCKEVADLASVDLGSTGSAAAAPAATAAAPPSGFKCGVEGRTRIVGGVQSTAGKYPWIAALQFSGQAPGGCAGTLVAAEWVVTAAHCLSFFVTKDNLKIILGEYDIGSATDVADTSRKEVSLAMDPIVHESFSNPLVSSNDIALLKLAEKVNLNVHTPACLPALNTDFTGKTASVYGWGTTASCSNSGLEKIMREVEVSIVSDATCEAASSTSVTFSDSDGVCQTQAANYNGKISEDMVCAGAQGKDSCQGDSGGPLTVKSSASQHELVGVVSWGAGCAADGLFGVYSEVAKLRTWIDTTIAANGGATLTP